MALLDTIESLKKLPKKQRFIKFDASAFKHAFEYVYSAVAWEDGRYALAHVMLLIEDKGESIRLAGTDGQRFHFVSLKNTVTDSTGKCADGVYLLPYKPSQLKIKGWEPMIGLESENPHAKLYPNTKHGVKALAYHKEAKKDALSLDSISSVAEVNESTNLLGGWHPDKLACTTYYRGEKVHPVDKIAKDQGVEVSDGVRNCGTPNACYFKIGEPTKIKEQLARLAGLTKGSPVRGIKVYGHKDKLEFKYHDTGLRAEYSFPLEGISTTQTEFVPCICFDVQYLDTALKYADRFEMIWRDTDSGACIKGTLKRTHQQFFAVIMPLDF